MQLCAFEYVDKKINPVLKIQNVPSLNKIPLQCAFITSTFPSSLLPRQLLICSLALEFSLPETAIQMKSHSA